MQPQLLRKDKKSAKRKRRRGRRGGNCREIRPAVRQRTQGHGVRDQRSDGGGRGRAAPTPPLTHSSQIRAVPSMNLSSWLICQECERASERVTETCEPDTVNLRAGWLAEGGGAQTIARHKKTLHNLQPGSLCHCAPMPRESSDENLL